MPLEQKMEIAIRGAPLSQELRREIGSIDTLIELFLAITSVLAALTATGFGAVAEVIGLSLLLAGAAASGVQIGRGLTSFMEFYRQVDGARTEADLERAGVSFADGIAALGVDALFLMLSILGARPRSKGDWISGTTRLTVPHSPSSAQSKSPPAQQSAPLPFEPDKRKQGSTKPESHTPQPTLAKKSSKGGSTTVSVDDLAQVITIRTNMEFSGSDASADYAKAAKKQIEDTWSRTCIRNGKVYRVKVEINTKLNSKGPPTADYDQIIVDKKTTRMNQTLFGAGPGNQTPEAATDRDRPRRIAHEYGHTLGLPDDYEETIDGCTPKDSKKKNNIMAETWPDKDGRLPHPYQDHYDAILKNHGW
jgi:hypothetical protein